eukprot:12706730-Alexandrium_andersonii.AAC.1
MCIRDSNFPRKTHHIHGSCFLPREVAQRATSGPPGSAPAAEWYNDRNRNKLRGHWWAHPLSPQMSRSNEPPRPRPNGCTRLYVIEFHAELSQQPKNAGGAPKAHKPMLKIPSCRIPSVKIVFLKFGIPEM